MLSHKESGFQDRLIELMTRLTVTFKSGFSSHISMKFAGINVDTVWTGSMWASFLQQLLEKIKLVQNEKERDTNRCQIGKS